VGPSFGLVIDSKTARRLTDDQILGTVEANRIPRTHVIRHDDTRQAGYRTGPRYFPARIHLVHPGNYAYSMPEKRVLWEHACSQ
jgi:hypothetical protein